MGEVPAIQAFPDGSTWAQACAGRFVDALSAALAETGRATFAGSGGSTPAPIYREMTGAQLLRCAAAYYPEWDAGYATKLVDRFALHDKTGVELGATPH